ncbi:MAG: hypothetical protein L6416_04365 [Candidatus Omnitrophica bacterium]|nr:hypothetical protein [Candidatus Omnitrophota bacterium]
MIEINLLPEAYKAKNEEKQQHIPVNLILLSINAILLAIFFIITAMNVGRGITLHAFDTRLKGLAPEQQKIISIQNKTVNLKVNNALFSPFVTNRFLWSKKLNLLSDLILPGIWLRQLSLEKEAAAQAQASAAAAQRNRFMKLEATAVSVTHDEMGVIGNFVRNLKLNKEFSQHFRGVELEGVLRREIATVEVMDFTLICLFKQEVEL